MAAVPVGKTDRDRREAQGVEKSERTKKRPERDEKERQNDRKTKGEKREKDHRDGHLSPGPQKVLLSSKSTSLPPSVPLLSSPGHKHQIGEEADLKKSK